MAPGYVFQVFFWIAIQDQIGIAQWVIVNKVIQLRLLRHGHVQFILDPSAVNTVGRNKKQIQEYIKNQLTEDQIADQVELKEFVDPFTGSVNKKA